MLHMADDLAAVKRTLRTEIRERRRTMSSTERAEAANGHTIRLQELTKLLQATSLACYLSTPDEPNTRPFLAWARSVDIRVLLPISRGDGLLDWSVGTGETEGPCGVPEPIRDILEPLAVNDVDLILVPAAAVDEQGVRLGWGRGYFDKTLGSMEKRPPVYAVVFESEVLERVPREVHDQSVDGAVTPTRIVTF